MGTAGSPTDQTSEVLQKLSLDPQEKSLEIPEPNKKTSVYQYGSLDPGNVINGQAPPFERATPVLPDFVDQAVVYYPAYFYGGYNGTGADGFDNTNYVSPEDMAAYGGIYGENTPLMYAGYGYAPYAPYSPASTPVPSLGHESQLYGPQQYHYPPYFPSPNHSSGAFSSTVPVNQGELSTSAIEQKPLPAESVNAATFVANSGSTKGSSGSAPVKALHQKVSYQSSSNSYDRGALAVSLEGFDSLNSLQNGSKASELQNKSSSSVGYTFNKANNGLSARTQMRSSPHIMGLQHPAIIPGIGGHGYVNRVYPSKSYSQYGNSVRPGMGYGSHGYDMRTYGRGWLSVDSKYKPRGRGGNYFYGSDNMDGLNELNRGPRARGNKYQKGVAQVAVAASGQNEASSLNKEISAAPEREQYNREDFPEDYADAKFFVIKSYSEDDVHKSIKYGVWASTPNGNKKLDQAYQDACQKSCCCPVFLLFSVNTSGQFVGLAEMVGAVDFNKNVAYWQQDKWTGSFPVKWHIVKDVPNSLLKHITLVNNENKPVTNSRDTQEVKLEEGLKIVKIFKKHSTKSSILDDFEFYEARQKVIQEKKTKQQLQKQVWEGKSLGEKKDSGNGSQKLSEPVAVVSLRSTSNANDNSSGNANSPFKNSGSNDKLDDGVSEKAVVSNGVANLR